jgi:hypothetical protein
MPTPPPGTACARAPAPRRRRCSSRTLYALLASTDDKALAERALQLALTDEPGLTNSAR